MIRTAVRAVVVVVACLGLAPAARAANPIALVVPQATAFSLLGHSCGGIQEQALASAFDPLSGDPQGYVYVQTRCGGSGRGGGYKVTTYSAWIAAIWDFGGGLVSWSASAPGELDPAFSATDAYGDVLANSLNAINVSPDACSVGNVTYCHYGAWLSVPLPMAPAGVTATAATGGYQVSWTAGSPAITSSTVTASPVGSSAPPVTATVTGTDALVGPLAPQTTYEITVVSTDAAGSSPPSDPIAVTTPASAVVPAAPAGVSARWIAPDTMSVTWRAAAGGDSPVDAYQVTVSGSDHGGTFTQTVDGSTLYASFSVSDIPDWSIKVRAHDAAGWGPWSATKRLGGT